MLKSLFIFCCFLVSFSSHAQQDAQTQSNVQVLCHSGHCYYGKFANSIHHPLKAGQAIELDMGDRIIGIGSGTHIEVVFADQSRVHMRDTSFFRIQEGNKQLFLSQGQISQMDGTGQRSESEFTDNANLVYIGDHPVNFIVPRAGEPIVLSSFPDDLHVVFRSQKGRTIDSELLKKWSLFDVDEQKFIKDFDFSVDENSFYRAKLTLYQKGNYLLVPVVEKLKGNLSGLKLHIKDSDAIEEIIFDLLKNSDTFGDSGIEIRGNSK